MNEAETDSQRRATVAPISHETMIPNNVETDTNVTYAL